MENEYSIGSTSKVKEHLVNSMEELTTCYAKVLVRDLTANENEQDKLNKEINEIIELMKHLETLSERPEWPNSFIKFNAISYIPATIIHTGEYFVKLGSVVYALMSLKETLAFLQRKVNRISDLLTNYKLQHQQLADRTRFSIGDSSELTDTTQMPKKIESAQGVAYKTIIGDYEIIEPYTKENEEVFCKNRKLNKIKTPKNPPSTSVDADAYFKKLDELEMQELELGEVTYKSDSNIDINNYIKMVLEKCNLYEQLKNDQVIQNLFDHDTSIKKANLNELIINALMNEPQAYKVCNEDMTNDFQNVLKNNVEQVVNKNVTVSKFLDSIES